MARHDVRKYVTRRGPRWVDHTGLRWGRLVLTAWVGYWRGKPWWEAACSCGRVTITSPFTAASCGCKQTESRHHKDFRTRRIDGTWGLVNCRPVVMADGTRFDSVTAMAKVVGISRRAMRHRLENWKQEHWLDPGQPSGRGQHHRKRLRKQWHATREKPRPQPWSRDNIARYNATRGQ